MRRCKRHVHLLSTEIMPILLLRGEVWWTHVQPVRVQYPHLFLLKAAIYLRVGFNSKILDHVTKGHGDLLQWFSRSIQNQNISKIYFLGCWSRKWSLSAILSNDISSDTTGWNSTKLYCKHCYMMRIRIYPRKVTDPPCRLRDVAKRCHRGQILQIASPG